MPLAARSRNRLLPLLGSIAASALLFAASEACAQVPSVQPPRHYQHWSDLPLGAIGQNQLQRGGPLGGYFQPVEAIAPKGALVSCAIEGTFEDPRGNTALAGMLIGQTYRLKVSNIPGREGEEVFPSIEVIDRLYPPPGQAARFPIPIELTQSELEMALEGRYVVRVIYIEDPRTALPVRGEESPQRYFEIPSDQDAMEVADRLGRPVAILRMGSRTPDHFEDGRFLHGSPPLVRYEGKPAPLPRHDGLEPPIELPGVDAEARRPIPRIPGEQFGPSRSPMYR